MNVIPFANPIDLCMKSAMRVQDAFGGSRAAGGKDDGGIVTASILGSVVDSFSRNGFLPRASICRSVLPPQK